MFYKGNIKKITLENTAYRKVIFTSDLQQLVVMSLNKSELIPMEIHSDTDQFFRIEKGLAEFIIDDNKFNVTDGDAVIVRAGSRHQVKNIGNTELKLYTIYSPKHHPIELVQQRFLKTGGYLF